MNLKKTAKNFFTPRFTTTEMENTQTRCGAEYKIYQMIYEDNRPTMPTRAVGLITSKKLGTRKQVSWNQFGECYFMGIRLENFDLIHPEARYICSAKTVFFSMVVFLIILLITAIWN